MSSPAFFSGASIHCWTRAAGISNSSHSPRYFEGLGVVIDPGDRTAVRPSGPLLAVRAAEPAGGVVLRHRLHRAFAPCGVALLHRIDGHRDLGRGLGDVPGLVDAEARRGDLPAVDAAQVEADEDVAPPHVPHGDAVACVERLRRPEVPACPVLFVVVGHLAAAQDAVLHLPRVRDDERRRTGRCAEPEKEGKEYGGSFHAIS